MITIDDPELIASVFKRDPETHLYGLADMEEPYWPNSVWHMEGESVVGLVSDGSDWATGYAMSTFASNATLGLLSRVEPGWRPGTWITGPVGLARTVGATRSINDIGRHWRMILDDVTDLTLATQCVVLTPADAAAIQQLTAAEPGGAFFMPSMLESNPFVGIFDGHRLVAMAGTHVASKRYGVAAIGAVLTHPEHRGQGLGRKVVSAICGLLRNDYQTIGLNVSADNQPALAIYDQLGFRRAFEYEEIELF